MKKSLIKLLYPGWKLYKKLVLQPLFAIMNTWFVWRLRNARSVKLHHTSPLPLDAIQERIRQDLSRDGISITHIDELFPNTSWFSDLRTYAYALKAQAFRNRVKTFWNEMWDFRTFLMDLDNPFLRFALEERNLAIANAHLGMYVRFQAMTLSETIPVEAGAEPIQSQKWHRDAGSKKYVKIFVYLNDVDHGCGPFTYVKGSQAGGRWQNLFPQTNPYGTVYGRIEDSEIEAAVPKEDIFEATGRAGTIVFADTVGLHKGSYSTTGTRFAAIIGFFSEKSVGRKNNNFQYPADFDERIRLLPPAAQFAVRRDV